MTSETLTAVPQWRFVLKWVRGTGAQPPILLSGVNQEATEKVLGELRRVCMCERDQEKACGQCRSCQLVAAGSHPDVIDLITDKKTWAIKDFRALFERISTTALAKRRLVVIHDIDKASLPSANVLLKSLEEPAATTRFVLTTRWPRRLLPTILSRCYHVRSHAPSLATSTATAKIMHVQPLTPELVEHVAAQLSRQLKEHGPSPELRRAFLRLRDYYLITAKRGNEKLAGEVLSLSLPLQKPIDN